MRTPDGFLPSGEITHPVYPRRCVHSSGSTRNGPLDAQLSNGIRDHRGGVIDELLAAYGREIQSVAYLILRNHADAEEVVIDTLVTAWLRSGGLREDAALRVWLLRIASRHALSRRRRRRIVQPIADAIPVRAPASSQPSLDRLIVSEAMGTLPDQMRAAVALHHVAGLTVPQAAEVLGKSENTVKSQLREGLARLRTALEEPQPTTRPVKGGTHARRA